MFGRRRRRRVVPNPSFNDGPKVNASAQAAAALAFLNPPASNSLSTAAAAAALRALPTTPTSVANVQTKRTMRRTNSNSSMGSSVAGSIRGPPGAQQESKGSSGSMTGRTFRDSSPNQGSARPSLDDAPPVPAIPKNLSPALPTQLHRRAVSMETPVRPRAASPLPNLATGRGSSLELYNGNPPLGRSAQGLSGLASVEMLTGVEQPNTRGSVNFSYPTGFGYMSSYGQRRLTSPTPSSAHRKPAPEPKQNLVYDPNTRSFKLGSELLFHEQRIRDAAERPVKRKKKVAPQGATGTHLADGTIGGRIKGTTAVNAIATVKGTSSETVEPQPAPKIVNTVVRRKTETSAVDASREVESYTPSVSDHESDNSEKPVKFNTRAGMQLAKKPSIVREDREREEAEDDMDKTLDRLAALEKLESGVPNVHTVSPSPVPSSNVPRGHGRSLAPESAAHAQSQQYTWPIDQPAPGSSTGATAPSTSVPANVDTGESDTGSADPVRVESRSLVRNTHAHFLTTPESLAVRHQPPARSASPIKSALKHSPPSRGSSPNGDVPGPPGTKRISLLSEISDSSTAMSDERSYHKKKSVRVSFDDESTVVLGQSDTLAKSDAPVSQAAQGTRGWSSGIDRGKRKDSVDMGDSDDEIMKPRPALPTFDSVREKKTREMEERPLVKPNEPSEPALSLGQSSDHAIGSVFAHDQVSRDNGNISRSREPLPPEVTTVEGSGYISDSGSSIDMSEHADEALREHKVNPEENREAATTSSTPDRRESEISGVEV